MIGYDRHFDQANTNPIIKSFFCAGEICWAVVQVLSISTKARQISLPTFGWERNDDVGWRLIYKCLLRENPKYALKTFYLISLMP